MAFKFQGLEVWHDALEYVDRLYAVADPLPESERFNLRSQVLRAGTSIALNIAEGSTGQTNSEQARFLGFAIRSTIETVACLKLIRRRGYHKDDRVIDEAYEAARALSSRLQAFRRAISPEHQWLRESQEGYGPSVSGEGIAN